MAAGDAIASLSLSGNLGLSRRTTRSSISFGRCPVRSSSLRCRWLSCGVFFVRASQFSIRELLQRVRIAATLSLSADCDFSALSGVLRAIGTGSGAAMEHRLVVTTHPTIVPGAPPILFNYEHIAYIGDPRQCIKDL